MTTEIVTNIDQRLQQVRAEINQLERARTALLDGSGSRSNVRPGVHLPKPAPKPRRARSKPKQASHDVVPAGKLTALLTGSEGMNSVQLAKAANGRPMQVLSLLRELETAGEVRRSGQRRGTRWHVITDEDRVAARAAELAAQSKRARARKS